MHFITNGYKRFSKTNSTDPRQRVPLRTKCQIIRQSIILLLKTPLIHNTLLNIIKGKKTRGNGSCGTQANVSNEVTEFTALKDHEEAKCQNRLRASSLFLSEEKARH